MSYSDKHLFFDLDRTLWDFEKNSQIALKKIFELYKLDEFIPNFYKFYYTYKNINAELWVKYGAGKISKEELRNARFYRTLKKFKKDDKVLSDKIGTAYIEISPTQKNLFPNTIEVLTELKKEGYRLHIITNGFKEVQYIKLTNCGLIDLFEVIVCSEEVGKNKPNPEVFNYAMQLANADSSKSVMIGDDLKVDILGASNVGMQTILFDPDKKYRKAKGDYVIKNLNEIPSILPWIFRSSSF